MPRCIIPKDENRISSVIMHGTVQRAAASPALLSINIVAPVDRLYTLRSILRDVKDKKGNLIFKTLHQCGNFVPIGNKNAIIFTGMENGLVYTSGIIRCNNPECPLCGNSRRQVNVRSTKKAIMATLLNGGRAVFGTATQHPTKDPMKSIEIVREFQKKARKIIDKRNWTINQKRKREGLEKKAALWFQSIIEATFSSKPIYKDEYQNPIEATYYIHAHTHFIIGSSAEFSAEIEGLLEKIKECWSKCVSSRHGRTFLNDTSSDILKNRAFQTDEINDDKGVSAYLSKIENKGDQLGLEINSGANKYRTGKGYGLNALLDKMILEPASLISIAHKENVRTWFKALFRSRRMLQTGVDEFSNVFDQMWREKADRVAKKRGFTTSIKEAYDAYLDDNGDTAAPLGTIDYKEIASAPRAAAKGWKVFMREDSLSLEPITKEILSAHKVAWVEEIGQTIYCKFRKIGEAGLIERVLRAYHYHGEQGDVYEKMMSLSHRWVPEGFISLVFMCYDRGLLLKGVNFDNLKNCISVRSNKDE